MPEEPKAAVTSTEIVLKWLFGQPFCNVVLIMIFCSIAWFGHYAVTIAVPSHLKMIQQVYETLDKNHQTEQTEMMIMYDKWMDRIDKIKSGSSTETSGK